MLKRICTCFDYYCVFLLINVFVVFACQPPIQYHSSAAYGSPQFQPDNSQSLDPSNPSFVQSSLREELVQNLVTPIESNVPVRTLDQSTVQGVKDLGRPPNNPFVPIEAQPAEKSAHECATKTIGSFMDVLDCTSVETYNSDGLTARYGTTECGFEPQTLCRFYSAPDEELQFRRGIFAHHNFHQMNNSQLQVNQFEDSFSSLTKRPLGSAPSLNFLVIAEPFGNTPKANAILQSDIRCQVGNGELSFDYWTTVEDVVLKVCTRVGQDRRCTSNILYAIDSTNVHVQIVHPEADSFIVEIIVSDFNHPGIFIIDNLEYQADLCEITVDSPTVNDQHLIARPLKAFSQPTFNVDGPQLSINGKSIDTNSVESGTPPSTPIVAETPEQPINNVPAALIDSETRRLSSSLKIQKMGENVCDILNCNFDNDLCHYYQPELKKDLMHGKWQTAKLRPDGSHQSNNRTGKEGFAFVGMDDRSIKTTGRKVYVLESKEFQLTKDAFLSFDLYRRSNSIALQVCVNSLVNCLYEASPVKSASYWKLNEQVPLPKDSKKVYFVAEQLKRFKWLAIDNIKLLSSECSSV